MLFCFLLFPRDMSGNEIHLLWAVMNESSKTIRTRSIHLATVNQCESDKTYNLMKGADWFMWRISQLQSSTFKKEEEMTALLYSITQHCMDALWSWAKLPATKEYCIGALQAITHTRKHNTADKLGCHLNRVCLTLKKMCGIFLRWACWLMSDDLQVWWWVIK